MKIEKPLINRSPDNMSWSLPIGYFDIWFDEHVEPINKMLSEGVEVYGSNNRPLDGWNQKSYESTTHKALLINIEPIKKETKGEACERLLSDWLKCAPLAKMSRNEVSIFQEAKAVLDE